jgi:hypothetical protein
MRIGREIPSTRKTGYNENNIIGIKLTIFQHFYGNAEHTSF